MLESDLLLLPLGAGALGLLCLLCLARLLVPSPPPPVGGSQAQERAEALLKEVLTEAEYRQLERQGYLEVPSPTLPRRVYRVPRHRGQVIVCEGGVAALALCVQPLELIPDGDVVLLHKLMIEGNEAEYLRIANRFQIPRDTFRRQAILR